MEARLKRYQAKRDEAIWRVKAKALIEEEKKKLKERIEIIMKGKSLGEREKEEEMERKEEKRTDIINQFASKPFFPTSNITIT